MISEYYRLKRLDNLRPEDYAMTTYIVYKPGDTDAYWTGGVWSTNPFDARSYPTMRSAKAVATRFKAKWARRSHL